MSDPKLLIPTLEQVYDEAQRVFKVDFKKKSDGTYLYKDEVHVCMYVMRNHVLEAGKPASYSRIGRMFPNIAGVRKGKAKNHTSVSHAYKKIEDQRGLYTDLDQMCFKLEDAVARLSGEVVITIRIQNRGDEDFGMSIAMPVPLAYYKYLHRRVTRAIFQEDGFLDQYDETNKREFLLLREGIIADVLNHLKIKPELMEDAISQLTPKEE